MKIIAFTMIKNEEDIIEQFIRHTLTYCDSLYIYDHFSGDCSKQIIDACTSEGLNVVILNDVIDKYIPPTIAHIQGEIMNVMLRVLHAAYGSAVFVALDADEFIIHEQGAVGFRSSCQAAPNNSWFKMPWRCLVLGNGTIDKGGDPLTNCRLAQKKSLMAPQGDKSIVKLDGKTDISDIFITYGNHEIIDFNKKLEKVDVPSAYYLHAPIRSSGQLVRKTLIGWLANVIRRGKVGDSAVHWGDLYQDMMKRNSFEFQDISSVYKHKGYSVLDLSLSENLEEFDCSTLLAYQVKYLHLRRGHVSVILSDLEEMMDQLFRKDS